MGVPGQQPRDEDSVLPGGIAVVFREDQDGLFSPSEFGFEGMILPESAYAEHAETNDPALLIHALHDAIASRKPHVTGCVRKGHFEVINFRVKPQFYFIGHNVSPDLLVNLQLLRLPRRVTMF